jgi:hypothetical protein
VLNLTRQLEKADLTSDPQKKGQRRQTFSSFTNESPRTLYTGELSGLRAKLRRAEIDAKATREYCKSFQFQSDTSRGMFEYYGSKSLLVSVSSPNVIDLRPSNLKYLVVFIG